jgi:hypothetical protein
MPIAEGWFWKAGSFHKAFKRRYFRVAPSSVIFHPLSSAPTTLLLTWTCLFLHMVFGVSPVLKLEGGTLTYSKSETTKSSRGCIDLGSDSKLRTTIITSHKGFAAMEGFTLQVSTPSAPTLPHVISTISITHCCHHLCRHCQQVSPPKGRVYKFKFDSPQDKEKWMDAMQSGRARTESWKSGEEDPGASFIPPPPSPPPEDWKAEGRQNRTLAEDLNTEVTTTVHACYSLPPVSMRAPNKSLKHIFFVVSQL